MTDLAQRINGTDFAEALASIERAIRAAGIAYNVV